jgi:hypothetical protein
MSLILEERKQSRARQQAVAGAGKVAKKRAPKKGARKKAAKRRKAKSAAAS